MVALGNQLKAQPPIGNDYGRLLITHVHECARTETIMFGRKKESNDDCPLDEIYTDIMVNCGGAYTMEHFSKIAEYADSHPKKYRQIKAKISDGVNNGTIVESMYGSRRWQ